MSENAQRVMETIPGLKPITHPLIKPPGIYFGMPEDEYHGALALSASGAKHINITLPDWWDRSVLNSNRIEDETDAKNIGKAFHKRIVEGLEAFNRCYARELDPNDFPDALKTVEHLKPHLELYGLKKSGKKEEMIAGLLLKHPVYFRSLIWECIEADYKAKHQGKEFISFDIIRSIEIAAAHIEKHPNLRKAFTGGYPEVSIFWYDHESGVPCKVRLDYLKPKAIIDLKTFEPFLFMKLDRAMAQTIYRYKYHVQAALYVEATLIAKRLIKEGKVFGKVEIPFLERLVAADELTFMIVFQKKGVAPVARGRIIPQSQLAVGSAEIDLAKAAFRKGWDLFGPEQWIDQDDIREFDASEFPAYYD